jgi:uncharacterized membrane protein
MANQTTVDGMHAQLDHPAVRQIGTADLRDALAKGIDDFKAKPSHIVFLCIIYPLVALFASRLTFGYQVLPLLFPLVAGFALVGPLAAIGLYELSRRREAGLEISWRHALGVVRSHSIGAIVTLGLVLVAIFLAWLVVAWGIYAMTLGGAPPTSVGHFAAQLFTTGAGWTLIVLGNGAGLLFAILVLTISVVSFPMLIDRDVSAMTAVQTSIRVVQANPRTMAAWGLIVAGSLAVGCIPFFVGLAIVMPVLGHATWHLYRKVVES